MPTPKNKLIKKVVKKPTVRGRVQAALLKAIPLMSDKAFSDMLDTLHGIEGIDEDDTYDWAISMSNEMQERENVVREAKRKEIALKLDKLGISRMELVDYLNNG